MSIEWGLPTVCDILKGAVILIKRPVKYAMSSKSFADDLREEVRKLENETRRVHNLAQVARNNRRILNDCFTEWQQSADKASEEARNLLDDFDKASKTCCYGTLPDPYCRYQFSTKAEAEIQVIRGLAENCIRFRALDDICSINTASGNVAALTPARGDGKDAVQSTTATASVISASTSIKARNDGVFESRALMIRTIMDALASNSNSVVGVYGMGGIGKSTLLVDVERKVSEEKSFHWVAKADVSENPDIKTIQGEIADALGLTEIKEKETISGRAKLLHDRLKDEEREKKVVLIILDNLWEGLDLNKVGIPCGHDNKVIGCKLLLTSRDRNVLRSKMGCDKDFLLGEMEEEEARSLFERLVGDKVHDVEFKPLVDEALQKCAGLPFLVVHMAKVFKHTGLSEWKNVLKQIKLSKNEGIGEVINERLQLSYKNLKDAEKSLLALCVAYGTSKPSLENLVRYGVGWGLFGEDDNMEEARESLKSGICTLQASSLLLEDGDAYGFKIHDLVREFIASVASRDHPLLILKDKDKSITELLKDKLKSCKAVCFPYVDMEELPQELDCPELEIFLFFTNNESLKVPYSLFHSMRKLMVLNLTGVCLTCSPSSSVQFLKNLHTLCLDDCLLDNVAILGELKGLQILSFANSNIHQLPKEIGQLAKLRLLDLNHCSHLEIVEPGVLRNLIKLEELYMENSFNQWNAVEQMPPTNASLIELNHMENLCTLYVYIPNPSMLPEDLNTGKLTKYEIQIGSKWHFRSKCKGSRILKLKLDPLSNVLWKGCIQNILGKIDDLFLDGLDGIEWSNCALSQRGFPKLRHLQVWNSPSIHYIHHSPFHTDFESLERLILENLINLEKLCHNHISFKSFSALKVVRVNRCHKMDVLFPLSLLRGLPQLEEIKVVGCQRMRGIVDADDGGKVVLHNLHVLELGNLPDIKSFFVVGTAPLSSTLHDRVGTQIAFFNEQQVAFSKLETLEIKGLDNVKFLFSPSMIKSLAQLRDLRVSNCKKMEAIIAKEEGLALEISETLAFPMLTNLNLNCLKSLMSFSREKCSREARSQDHIKSCSTALFSQEVAFPKLEALDISGLDNFEMIWDNKVAVDSFPNLKTLCVVDCNKLVSVVRSFILRQLLSLERLDARRCGSLEIVFELQTVNHLDGHPIALPLTELTVSRLPKLKCIWDKELHCQIKFQCLRSISVSGCESLTSLFRATVTRDLIQLEKLAIDECGIVEIIKSEEGLVPKFVFPMLTSLELEHLKELKCLYKGTHTSHWPALKTLKVHGCDKVEILASHYENEVQLDKLPLFLIEKGAFPNLQELKLDLSEQMEIWHEHFNDGEFFCKLRLLKLRHLSQESSISTCRFVESSTNLEELVVCESYLKDPSSNEEAIEGTSQEMKVILPFSRYIRHLQTLDVSHCDGLSKMFTPTIAENLVALTKLRISNCRTLTEVINDEKGGEGRVVAFNQLKYMELDGLIELRSFCSAGYTLMFPLLEDIIVTRCPNMKFFSQGPIEASKLKRVQVSKEVWFWAGNLNITIQNMFEEMGTFIGVEKMLLSDFPGLIGKWHNKLSPIKSSWQLKSMVVDKCPFINAIPSRLMLVLDNLNYLQVCDCELLEEIFDFEGLEVVESTRILPQLWELNLANLPKLRRLWNRDLQESIHFDSLATLILYNCSNLGHAFTSSMAQCLANLYHMEIKECGQMEEVIVEEEGQGSTVEKITFSKLRQMKLEWLPNLTCFLLTKNHTLECSNLRMLSINHCPKMRSLTGQSRMDNDHGIPAFFTSQVQCPKLERMYLSHMDNLSKIWSGSPQETLTFDNLWKMQVQNCRSLENVFPHWVATSLTQIKELQVESCGIEEIVASGNETSHSNTTQDLFPKLTSLVLHDMPQLKNFRVNLPTLNWPFLKELRVTHCGKANMPSFVASISNWAKKDYQQGLSDQEAHSLFERDFPNLERLLLVDNNIQMIQDGNFPEDIFGKPKALTLACFHNENAVFPLKFLLERFQNLQSLEIFCSSFEDIFLDEGLVDNAKHPVLESLRELKLNKLHNLKSVWREGSLVLKILQSIETFEVWDCPCLTTIFPTMTSFKNLTKLVVKNSSGLVHLVTASMVTNLVHLNYMTLIGCERMKEIVANDRDGEGKMIFFGNLCQLTFQNLPNLECFSSIPSCIFRFPYLWRIEVEECPKMKTFSKGMLSTPGLEGVSLFRYKWKGNWEKGDDLNTTIQKLAA